MAVAPEPLPPDKVTVGTDVYADPVAVSVNPVTKPPETEAVAVAPEPPPPVMPTVGALEYPLPDAVTTNVNTTPLIAVAKVVVVPVTPVLYSVSVPGKPSGPVRYILAAVDPVGNAGIVTCGMLPEETVNRVEALLGSVSPAEFDQVYFT